MDAFSDHFPGNCHKMPAENYCDCRQNRSEQKSAIVTVPKHCIYFKLERNCFENIHREKMAKRLSFLNIENLSIRSTKMTMIFCLSKTHQKKHVEVA